jgi:hypothetical protein
MNSLVQCQTNFFLYYIENSFVIIFKRVGVGRLMFIRLDIDIWVISKSGTKKEGVGKGLGVWGELWRLLDFLALCVFGCISVVMEGACVRDCRGWGYVQLASG